jgi:DNA-binding response OmpR family regulator
MDPKQTVLIVDDEPTIRELIAALLTDEGFMVQCAGDGAEALAVVAADAIDLVISDVAMPRLDGRALARRLQARAERVPVVLMSANDAERGVPGVPLLTKPFDVDRLLDMVDAALASSKRAIFDGPAARQRSMPC